MGQGNPWSVGFLISSGKCAMQPFGQHWFGLIDATFSQPWTGDGQAMLGTAKPLPRGPNSGSHAELRALSWLYFPSDRRRTVFIASNCTRIPSVAFCVIISYTLLQSCRYGRSTFLTSIFVIRQIKLALLAIQLALPKSVDFR